MVAILKLPIHRVSLRARISTFLSCNISSQVVLGINQAPLISIAPRVATESRPNDHSITRGTPIIRQYDVIQKLAKGDYDVEVSEVDRILIDPDVTLLVGETPIISLRAGLLHFSRRLSKRALISCLELFSRGEVADHQFFKEIGKALFPKVDELSVSEIATILRSHAIVGATETDLFGAVHGRLSSVVNRANIHVMRDILVSLSLLEGGPVDSQRMVELCLNRYSLSAKDEIPVDIDKDVLIALARLGLVNNRVIKRSYAKILLHVSRIGPESIVQILGSLWVLGSDPGPLWRIAKLRYFRDLSVHTSTILCDLSTIVGLYDPKFAIEAAAVVARRMQSVESSLEQSSHAFKHSMSLSSLCMFEPVKFEKAIQQLSTTDLADLDRMLSTAMDSTEMKPALGTFISSKDFSFTKKRIGGLFLTQIMEPCHPNPSKVTKKRCQRNNKKSSPKIPIQS